VLTLKSQNKTCEDSNGIPALVTCAQNQWGFELWLVKIQQILEIALEEEFVDFLTEARRLEMYSLFPENIVI